MILREDQTDFRKIGSAYLKRFDTTVEGSYNEVVTQMNENVNQGGMIYQSATGVNYNTSNLTLANVDKLPLKIFDERKAKDYYYLTGPVTEIKAVEIQSNVMMVQAVEIRTFAALIKIKEIIRIDKELTSNSEQVKELISRTPFAGMDTLTRDGKLIDFDINRRANELRVAKCQTILDSLKNLVTDSKSDRRIDYIKDETTFSRRPLKDLIEFKDIDKKSELFKYVRLHPKNMDIVSFIVQVAPKINPEEFADAYNRLRVFKKLHKRILVDQSGHESPNIFMMVSGSKERSELTLL